MQPPSHGEHTGWRASDYPSGHGALSNGRSRCIRRPATLRRVRTIMPMLPNFSSNVFQTDCGVSGILAGRAVCLTAYQSQISHTFSSISADGRNAIDTPPSGLKKVV